MHKNAVIFLALLVLVPFTGYAEDYGSISALEETLKDLRDSSDEIKRSNDQLHQFNTQLGQEITQLQLKLGQLQEQEKGLTQSAFRLQDKNEAKAKQIALVQKDLFALDAKFEKANADVKEAKDMLVKMNQEDQNLNEQLTEIQHVLPEAISNTGSLEVDSKRKEKINLLKMIDQSHVRQEQLNQALSQLRPTGQAIETVQLLAQREAYQAQINELQRQLRELPMDVAVAGNDVYNPDDVKTLMNQMASLEQNYSQLRDLWLKMQDKAQVLQMNPSQKIEKSKLAKNLTDLNQQSSILKGELQTLREQMVELDKRKTRLQEILSK